MLNRVEEKATILRQQRENGCIESNFNDQELTDLLDAYYHQKFNGIKTLMFWKGR